MILISTKLILGLILSVAATAEDYTWVMKLDKDTIPPGAPLQMILSYEICPKAGSKIDAVGINYDNLKVIIRDLNGTLREQSTPPPWRASGNFARHIWTIPLLEKQHGEKPLVFNEWCSTGLLPGEYKITCELTVSYSATEQAGEKHFVHKKVPAPKLQWTLPLTVLKPDDEAVRLDYKRWEEIALKKEGNADENDEKKHAIEMIVYARSSLALPFQISLLTSSPLNEVYYIDIGRNFISTQHLETAIELMKLVDGGKYPNDWVKEMYCWMIYGLRDSGKTEILKATEEFIKMYPRPREPRYVDFMN
jgi:hypothetical protein